MIELIRAAVEVWGESLRRTAARWSASLEDDEHFDSFADFIGEERLHKEWVIVCLTFTLLVMYSEEIIFRAVKAASKRRSQSSRRTAEEQGPPFVCRICHGEEERADALLQPCRCRGTQARLMAAAAAQAAPAEAPARRPEPVPGSPSHTANTCAASSSTARDETRPTHRRPSSTPTASAAGRPPPAPRPAASAATRSPCPIPLCTSGRVCPRTFSPLRTPALPSRLRSRPAVILPHACA